MGDGNDEMLGKLNEKCGDDELALRALAHGDGVWLMYFEGELTGDAMWVLHSDFVEFSKLVNAQQEEDKYMYVCARQQSLCAWALVHMRACAPVAAVVVCACVRLCDRVGSFTVRESWFFQTTLTHGNDGDGINYLMNHNNSRHEVTYGNGAWVGYWEGTSTSTRTPCLPYCVISH